MEIVEFVEVASDVDVEEAVDSSEGNCTDGWRQFEGSSGRG